MLKQAIETTKPSQPPPAGYTPSPDDFTESDYEAMKNCLNNPKVVTDVTNQLISKGQPFIEKIKKASEEIQKPPPTNMSEEEIKEYMEKTSKNANILFKLQDILLTVIGQDCDIRSIITKIQKQTKRTPTEQ